MIPELIFYSITNIYMFRALWTWKSDDWFYELSVWFEIKRNEDITSDWVYFDNIPNVLKCNEEEYFGGRQENIMWSLFIGQASWQQAELWSVRHWVWIVLSPQWVHRYVCFTFTFPLPYRVVLWCKHWINIPLDGDSSNPEDCLLWSRSHVFICSVISLSCCQCIPVIPLFFFNKWTRQKKSFHPLC